MATNERKASPLFVVIEGVDRVGKNTQADLLARRLNQAGERAWKLTTPDYETATGALIGRYLRGKVGLRREGPGGDALGKSVSIHALVDNTRVMNSLMIVNRYEVASKIRAALGLGHHVVCVRWWPSPYLYGAEDGLDGEPILEACALLPEPDLYVLLDAEVSSFAHLLDQESKYEACRATQERLVHAYRELWAIPPDAFSSRRPPLAAGQRPGAWPIVSASGSPDEVSGRVWRAVLGARPELGSAPGGEAS